MANQAKINGEVDFLRKLYDVLVLQGHFQLVREPVANGADVDLLVKDQTSGKMVAIELKNAGEYGELPISTIIPISRLVHQGDKYEKVLLITFSEVPELLSQKLQELNVEALKQPTINEVVEKVQLALSA
jgi:hypothetical protein